MRLTTDNLPLAQGGGGSTTLTQQWVFFAISYDGTLTSNNVNFYSGTIGSTVSLINQGTINAGAITDDAVGFALGNGWNAFSRPFDGLMDNVRIFGSKTDATGVLGLSDLQYIQSQDLNNEALAIVPEPGSATMIASGIALLGLVRRRRGVGLSCQPA
jgi:hypothetical protein